MTQLTTNFTLEELCYSSTAKAKGITEQFTPSLDIISCLKKLAVNILQPLRDGYGGGIQVNCAYRCKRLNDAVKGANNSQHLQGKAADITVGNKYKNQELFDLIVSLNLPFDQLIDEQDYSWIHVSYDETRNRKQILHL
jgi:zinc D-Ala-D-Ala carboxypeptidase